MSPLWRNRLRIVLAPGHISLIKYGREWKPVLLAEHGEAVAPSTQPPSWQPALGRLDEILGEAKWQDAEVEVVLSNRLLRYAVVSFDARLQEYAEQQAYASHVLSQNYSGDEKRQLRIQPGKPGAGRLVSAVDATLLDGLRQMCIRNKLKLRSVTPWLMHAFNRHGGGPGSTPAWLVVNEPGYSLFALLDKAGFMHVHGASHASLSELPLLLDRENLLSPLPVPCKSVYLYAPQESEAPAIDATDYEFNNPSTTVPKRSFGVTEVPHLRRPGMERLEIDFQQPAERPRKAAGWALLLAGLALVAEMAVSYDRLHDERMAMRHEKRNPVLHMEAPGNAATGNSSERDYLAGRQIVGRLAVPWENFFAGLEAVDGKNVAILSIVPDMQTGLLQMEGEARDYAAILTLIAKLDTMKPFSDVVLTRHEIKRDDPQHPVGFALAMRWEQRP